MPAFFPYDSIRQEQDQLIQAVESTIKTRQSLVAHAPTGLGKTAAALAPAVEFAIKNEKTVVFLTGRHTQHQIALDTLRAIKTKHDLDFSVVDLVGKQWFCLQPGVERLYGKGFHEYCKAMKEDKQCSYYENLKEGDHLSAKTKQLLAQLQGITPITTGEVKEAGRAAGLCPYEVTLLLAAKARVIITDYQYIFNPGIRDSFLARLGKDLGECIIIVDEAHNLPDRVKDLGSDFISTTTLQRAMQEAEKYQHDEILQKLRQIAEQFVRFITLEKDEKYVSKEAFIQLVEKTHPYEKLQEWLEKTGDAIREEQRVSFIGTIADFLKSWEGGDTGYARIMSKDRDVLTLSYKCLDPSVITHEVFENCHSAVLMSGTLTPPGMYASVLGVSQPNLLTLESPFPHENRLNLIIPKTSTKFTQRSEDMWEKIGTIIKQCALATPGNVAVFFPSYAILNEVHKYVDQGMPKTVLVEHRQMGKEEKQAFLEKFKGYKDTGAVLLGVISGNFGEGIDLPGDLLKCVIVVGLPLSKPDLETQALINYYDAKFRKGWEYGYTIPAFNKTLQSAGRCIRTETDKGVVIFLDERYEWPRYAQLFPKDWNIKSTLLYEKMITEFFSRGSQPARPTQ